MGTERKVFLTIFFLIFLTGGMLRAEILLVTNNSELEAALHSAIMGDSIVLKDGVWTGLDLDINCKGTEELPITVCAETPGGASLEAGSRIEIGGEYVIVSGLIFTNGYNVNNAIRFASEQGDARHCRLTSCMIEGYNPPDPSTKYHWVVMYGAYNRIDHCRFNNMTHRGVTVMIKAGADQEGHHRIDHNYFGDKPEGAENAYETLKLGGGDYSMYPLYTLVEKNFFYRCDGEVELISNKSWENIYRHNTFYESMGTLTLRWGRKCLVEGNYFIGNGRDDTGGIRLTDQDHVVINNYLIDLDGKDARAAISIMSGIPDAEGGNSGHGQTRNASILHNTIINCKESINMGYYDDDDLGDPRGDLLPPENCTIANNIICGNKAPLIKEDWQPSINTTWESNIAFGADLGLDSTAGFIFGDPMLVESINGIKKFAQGSPAVDAAQIYPGVDYDFEMQPRDALPDIGADEFSDAPAESLPVMAEDVGPEWYVATSILRKEKLPIALKAYPNPARDRFFLDLDPSILHSPIQITITDLSGRQVYSEQSGYLRHNPEINTGNLSGLYLVRVLAAGRLYQTRIHIIK